MRDQNMADCLHEDLKIREILHQGTEERRRASAASLSSDRPRKCRMTIYSARPGVVIGKKGADIEKLRKMVSR